MSKLVKLSPFEGEFLQVRSLPWDLLLRWHQSIRHRGSSPSFIVKLLAHLSDMPYGKDRRKLIKEYFLENPTYEAMVDCEHCQQVKNDPDLKKLIKQGFLKRNRSRYGSSNRTFLSLNNG